MSKKLKLLSLILEGKGVIKLKLNRQRPESSNNVKYLGIKINENLNWKHHINEVSTKLIRANAILFKIRNYVNPKILRSIFLAIFESHLIYSSIFWVQSPGSIKCLIILQKKALRIINFKPRNCHNSPLFKENVILKLIDKVHLGNILFVNKCINNLLPPIFNDWFTLVSAQHSYQTSSSTKEKLFKPPFKTISYGKNSVVASSIQSWNKAQQKLGSLKTLPSAKIIKLITDEVLKYCIQS